jgi:uncharacterized membrane protein YagU involved in acid resistance
MIDKIGFFLGLSFSIIAAAAYILAPKPHSEHIIIIGILYGIMIMIAAIGFKVLWKK